MSQVATNRLIDLTALPFSASQRWSGDAGEVEADVPEADLQAAVDAAPEHVEPDPAAARQRFRDAVSNATSIADLKAALLGTDTNAEPDVRPR